MVRGEFYENIPFVKIIVAWGQAVQTPLKFLRKKVWRLTKTDNSLLVIQL